MSINNVEYIFITLFITIVVLLYLRLVELGKEWRKLNTVPGLDKELIVKRMLKTVGYLSLTVLCFIIYLIYCFTK